VSTSLGSFDKATAVERSGPGRYVARVDPVWDGPGAPLGGVGAATILRAMIAEFAASDFAPRSVTVHFSQALVHGPAEIEVQTLRRGRHLATVQAHAVQEGVLRCAALATFGQPFPETAAWEAEPPAAPSPEESAEVDLPAEQVPHTQHLRFRPVFGPPPGPVLARFASRVSREGYWDEDGELWSGDRQLLAQSRQLRLLRPLAES